MAELVLAELAALELALIEIAVSGLALDLLVALLLELGLASALGILAAIAIPYVFDRTANTVFTEMPAEFFVFLILILVLYSVTIEIVKKLYTRKYGDWL